LGREQGFELPVVTKLVVKNFQKKLEKHLKKNSKKLSKIFCSKSFGKCSKKLPQMRTTTNKYSASISTSYIISSIEI